MSNEKENGITIRIALTDLEKDSVYDKVIEYLKANKKYAYTIIGLLIKVFGYSSEDLNSSFGNWPKGAATQYSRVRAALCKLEKEGLVEARKQGKKVLYWYKGD